MKFKDLTGKKINRWTVLSRAPNKEKHTMWHCRCECGNKRIVNGSSLSTGSSKSCGCLHSENTAKRNFKHGMSKRGKASSTYLIWASMLKRCNNENTIGYENYGGRGIEVCERWNDFANFLKDMGERPSKKHSIDRIDVNGNYEPSNCKWSNRFEQTINRRTQKNNKSGCHGVSFIRGKWHAYISINKKRIHLGVFDDKSDAIKTRKRAELKYWKKPS